MHDRESGRVDSPECPGDNPIDSRGHTRRPRRNLGTDSASFGSQGRPFRLSIAKETSIMNRTRRILSALGFALAVATTASGCLVTASGHARLRSGAVVVYDEPPAPRYEQVSTRSA